MPDPRAVLAAYSNQQATTEEVWRALTEHSGWYVPAAFGVQRLHTTSSQGATIFANELQTSDNALILFTDSVAAARAEGAPIGTFMHEFSGVQIFGALTESYGCVRVNPHSPKNEGWYISQEAFPLAQLWSQVVGLEQAIGNASGNALPFAQIAAHPGFMVLINSQHLPVTMHLKQPEGTYGVVFTSPDRYQAFVAKQSPENQANLKSATLDGASLCKQLASFDLAGLLIYYRDGAGVVLRRDEFKQVTGE